MKKCNGCSDFLCFQCNKNYMKQRLGDKKTGSSFDGNSKKRHDKIHKKQSNFPRDKDKT